VIDADEAEILLEPGPDNGNAADQEVAVDLSPEGFSLPPLGFVHNCSVFWRIFSSSMDPPSQAAL